MTAPVRGPLIREMADAAQRAIRSAPHTLEGRYHTGLFTGYTIALTGSDRDQLTVAADVVDARAETWSEFTTRHAAEAVLADLVARRRLGEAAWASGVLFGYWMGTGERADAAQCVWCDRRICTDVDPFVACRCGVFCPLRCADEAHVSGAVHCGGQR